MEENDKTPKDSGKIYTVLDLLKKLNKNADIAEMEVDDESNETDVEKVKDNNEIKYGIWTLMPGNTRTKIICY